jgi:hypothetical protein
MLIKKPYALSSREVSQADLPELAVDNCDERGQLEMLSSQVRVLARITGQLLEILGVSDERALEITGLYYEIVKPKAKAK